MPTASRLPVRQPRYRFATLRTMIHIAEHPLTTLDGAVADGVRRRVVFRHRCYI
jgi:hypothetical protein